MRRICFLMLLAFTAPAAAQPAPVQSQRAQQVDRDALRRAQAAQAAQAFEPCSFGAIRLAFARNVAPALVGCRYDQLREPLALYAQRISVGEAAGPAEAGTIADQSPAPGVALARGGVLTLTVSTGPAPAPVATETPEPEPSATPDATSTPDAIPTPEATEAAPAPVETAIAEPVAEPAAGPIPWWLVPALVAGAALMLLGGLVTALRRRPPAPEPDPEPVAALAPLRFATEIEPGGAALVAEHAPLLEGPKLQLGTEWAGETRIGAVAIEEERVA